MIYIQCYYIIFLEKIQEFFKNGIPTKEGMQEIEKQIISVEKSRQEMQENRIYQLWPDI